MTALGLKITGQSGEAKLKVRFERAHLCSGIAADNEPYCLTVADTTTTSYHLD